MYEKFAPSANPNPLAAIVMRLFIYLLLFIPMYACQDSHKPKPKNTLSDDLMVGEWRVDSSSNRHFSHDKLFLLENGSFYIFSGADGGSILTKGKKFDINHLATAMGDTLTINLLDSNQICIRGGWSNNEDYYKRSGYSDLNENLKKYLKSDSLRKKVIGWWKLVSSKMPVKLINYSGYYEKFTLNVRDDGQAVFYLENNLDSTVNYSYKTNPDGIDLIRGCIVGSNCKISLDENGKMKLLLGMGDTLLLERLTEIK
ncbi:MAG: hypothetical protein AB1458_09975 [Bacteroidota bacterium]